MATKDSHFIFDGTLYKQIDGAAMGFPLGPTLANAFFVYHKKNWLEHCPVEYRPLYYCRYVDDIFVLFNSAVETTQKPQNIAFLGRQED